MFWNITILKESGMLKYKISKKVIGVYKIINKVLQIWEIDKEAKKWWIFRLTG